MTLEGGVTPESLARVRDRLVAVKRDVRDGLQQAFIRSGSAWEGKVGARFTGTTGPRSLRTRSGRLARAVSSRVTGASLADLKLTMQVKGVPYARVQEFGGEIKPKRGKYLTIPTSFNQKPTGVTDYPSARELISAHPKSTFFGPGRRGGLYLFWTDPSKKALRTRTRKFSDRRAGGVEKGAPIPMFALVKKVDLPGPNSPSKRGPSRLGVYDTWREELPDLRRDLKKLAGSITNGVSGALGGA